MIFNSFNFLVFFPLIFLLYYLIPSRYHQARNVFLLVVSYLLYFNYTPVYSLVLLYVTIVSFITAKAIDKYSKDRRVVLAVGGVLGIIPLLMFKYYNFVNNNVFDLLTYIGLRFHTNGLNWAIPIGLSFFTLQSLSYVFDVYNNKYKSEHDLLSYSLYLSFFPTITMGPITRANDIIPQIKSIRIAFDSSKIVDGCKLLLWGMFLKVVIADRAGIYVDTVMDNYRFYTGSSCFVASIMYSVQIYADFAGYSFMAIGTGKILGFNIKDNFCRPFFSYSVSNYWTRWHISLSSWLKDYIYIPLGGSREGIFKTYRNIFITFLVSGIWHGANWTFILWGIWHAVCVMTERFLNQQRCRYKGIRKALKIVIAFLLINFSRILFHSPTVTDSYNIMNKIFTWSSIGELYFPASVTAVLALSLFVNDGIKEFFPHKEQMMNNRYALIRWSTYVFLLVVILLEGVLDSGHFIYANF